MLTRLSRVSALAIVLSCFASAVGPALSQGQGTTDYLNFESVQTSPLATVQVGGFDYLIACNTPDNSVEIYHVTDGAFGAIVPRLRFPVGLEPVAVTAANDGTEAADIYVCGFVSDSISHLRLESTGDPVAPQVTFERTINIALTAASADEPIDVTVLDDVVLVALRNANSVARFDRDLNPLVPHIVAAIEGAPGLVRLLKEPRRIVGFEDPVAGPFTWVLDTQGGGDPSRNFNLALFSGAMETPQPIALAPLGTANFGLAVGAGSTDSGDLYIVGQRANLSAAGEEAVKDSEFGFAESVLFHLEIDYTVPRQVRARVRNLNQDSQKKVVPPREAIAQPMAVLPYYRGAEDVLFVASFGTDRIVRIGNLAANPIDWTREFFDLGVSGTGSPIAGPRGLALVLGGNPTLDRLYVMNRLDNSIAVIEPSAPSAPLAPIIPARLGNDPTPQYIRSGREFLYNAKISQSGFNSCASCHLDGRLDGLRWDLSDGSTQSFDDDLFDPSSSLPNRILEPDKGPMVTQSLQGLVNWEAELDRSADLLTQEFMTNAPYHWRGDRADFNAFLGAFENLLGARAGAVTLAEMHQFERFVNSITYPPNPVQDPDRKFDFTELGEDPNLVDPTQGPDIGFGAALGLKAFHVIPSTGDRSCVHCHSLPEGSNNLVPQQDAQFASETVGNGPIEPFIRTNAESAALRGEDQKSIVGLSGSGGTGGIGLFKKGSGRTVREIAAAMIGTTVPEVVTATADFFEQFDSGIAPMVGRTVTETSPFDPSPPQLDQMLEQARVGNLAIALRVWRQGQFEGYWFDQTGSFAGGFRREIAPGPGAFFTYEDLVATLGVNDRVVILAVPLGSERRVASPGGRAAPPAGSTPPSIAPWIELAPNSLYTWVPLFVDNWTPARTGFPPEILPLQSAEVPRLVQIIGGYQEQLGMFPGRHEPPRRFRIAGNDIRPGAVLEIAIDGTCTADYDLRLPIYPTGDLRLGQRVWTTAAEIEPDKYYAWLTPAGSTHALRVRNPDGSSACLEGVPMEMSELELFRRGDVDVDGDVDTDDFSLLQSIVGAGGTLACEDAADVDDNGVIGVGDLIAIADYLNAVPPGPIPGDPIGNCGRDETMDSLDCAVQTCP